MIRFAVTAVAVVGLAWAAVIALFGAWVLTAIISDNRRTRHQQDAAAARIRHERARENAEREAAETVLAVQVYDVLTQAEAICRAEVSRRRHPSWRPDRDET